MNKKQKAELITTYFNDILPFASCELNYTKDYELLIAVMLSSQTTDKAVNKVTDKLFIKYPTLNHLNQASVKEIELQIKELGLYKNKAKNIKKIAEILINEYNNIVPSDFEKLVLMPGIGRKTANVVRCELFKIPEFPVDTHINRIAKRLNIAKDDDSVLVVEDKLKKLFRKEQYILLHHQFIHFGRYYCSSQNPSCENCKLKLICKHINR